MSAIKEKYIKCDGACLRTCTATFGKPFNESGYDPTFDIIRENAKRKGWASKNAWDFCPSCLALLSNR